MGPRPCRRIVSVPGPGHGKAYRAAARERQPAPWGVARSPNFAPESSYLAAGTIRPATVAVIFTPRPGRAASLDLMSRLLWIRPASAGAVRVTLMVVLPPGLTVRLQSRATVHPQSDEMDSM